MDVEKRNSEIRAAFHAAGIKGRGIVFDVLDSGAVAVDTMRPVNMSNVEGDTHDHGTKVAWLLHEACPEAEIRSYYCASASHLNIALADILERAPGEPEKQHVVNISMVVNDKEEVDRELERLIDALTAIHVPVVCAAGNDGEEKLNRFPSCFQSPYTASAIDPAGSKCDFTTWHDEVDFCELGYKVLTKRADGATIRQSGTSFSSPILAGKIGLLLCEARMNSKGLTDAELYEKLKAGAVDLGPDGRDPYFGWGYVEIMPQAIEAEPEPEEMAKPESKVSAKGLCDWCESQLGQIYVWGGNGQEATPSKIKSMETSTTNANRALALYNKRLAEGLDPIAMYDCSGLISRYLQNNGIVSKKRNCDHLADMCSFVRTSRSDEEMEPGDLLFRWKSGEEQYYHVGVYVGIINGERWAIESKGRDDGVVLRKINASGSSYWNRWGRLKVFAQAQPSTPEEPGAPTVLKVTTPYMRGDGIKLLQQALNALGYPCGEADGICGKNTMAGVNAFVAAHGSGELPESIKAYVTINGRKYTGELEG